MTFDEGAVGAQAVALKIATEGGFAVFADEDFIQAGMEWSDMDRNDSDVLRRSATGGEHQLARLLCQSKSGPCSAC